MTEDRGNPFHLQIILRNISNIENLDEEVDYDEVPDGYTFPSFMTFVTLGPFSEPEIQLNLLLTDNTLKKKGEDNHKSQRAKVKKEKDLNRSHDNTSA